MTTTNSKTIKNINAVVEVKSPIAVDSFMEAEYELNLTSGTMSDTQGDVEIAAAINKVESALGAAFGDYIAEEIEMEMDDFGSEELHDIRMTQMAQAALIEQLWLAVPEDVKKTIVKQAEYRAQLTYAGDMVDVQKCDMVEYDGDDDFDTTHLEYALSVVHLAGKQIRDLKLFQCLECGAKVQA